MCQKQEHRKTQKSGYYVPKTGTQKNAKKRARSAHNRNTEKRKKNEHDVPKTGTQKNAK